MAVAAPWPPVFLSFLRIHQESTVPMITAGCAIGCAIIGCGAAGTWIWKAIPGCSPGGICTCITPPGVCTCIGMPPCMPCGTCTDTVCIAVCACIIGCAMAMPGGAIDCCCCISPHVCRRAATWSRPFSTQLSTLSSQSSNASSVTVPTMPLGFGRGSHQAPTAQSMFRTYSSSSACAKPKRIGSPGARMGRCAAAGSNGVDEPQPMLLATTRAARAMRR
eukprot:scaffold97918_cov63-Phaeocystis_antarctica.AAC.2